MSVKTPVGVIETPVVKEIPQLSLAQKLVKVRASIGGFSKDTKADKYQYVSGSQVLSKVLDTMNELNLLLVPSMVHGTSVVSRYNYTRKYKSGGESEVVDYVVESQMMMTWIDADTGETLEVPWQLYGEQESDVAKAFGSGLTYTERYFLMKFFNQPTDADDPDAKKEPKEPPKPMLTPEEQKAQEEAEAIGRAFIDANALASLEAELQRTRVPASEMFRVYGIQELSEMTNKDWTSAMRGLATMPTKQKKEPKEGTGE